MSDLRIKRMAKVIARYCLDLKEGQYLHIGASDLAKPLIREIYKEALRTGTHIVHSISIDGLTEYFYTYATKKQLEHVSEYARFTASFFDAYLTILGGYNTKSLSNVDPAKMSYHAKANESVSSIQKDRMASGEIKLCATQFPTYASAQDACMSYFRYAEFVFQACFLNDDNPIQSWQNLAKWQAKIIDYLSTKDQIRVVAQDTDLTMRTKGRTWVNCDGKVNFPDGEVFTGPIENSVNGKIRFTFPGIYMGREIEDIYLEFKDGKAVKALAGIGQDVLLAQLNSDEGARYVGEFAIGTNYGIDRFTKNMLFDEKIGGTIHLAMGMSIPVSGGVNQSVIHWDMLCNMKDGGEIYADGELFYKNGSFTKEF